MSTQSALLCPRTSTSGVVSEGLRVIEVRLMSDASHEDVWTASEKETPFNDPSGADDPLDIPDLLL